MPESYDLVITNGVCVTAADIAPYDIAINGEKIVLLAPSGSLAGKGSKEIDVEGGYVMVRSCVALHTETSDQCHSLAASTVMCTYRSQPCSAKGHRQIRTSLGLALQLLAATLRS
jgi:hypothetical protein